MWEQVPNDSSVLAKTLMKAQENIRQENIRLGWDLSKDTLHYFLVKDKSTRFYLLPEIHKVISNCGYYTENISSFLDCYLQPLTQKVKSFIKDASHFLNKKSLEKLSQEAIICTIEDVGIYRNIPHGEGLT